MNKVVRVLTWPVMFPIYIVMLWIQARRSQIKIAKHLELKEPEPQIEPVKTTEPEPSHWKLQLLDDFNRVLAQEDAVMCDKEDGLIIKADFPIIATIATIYKSRVIRKGKIIGTNSLNSPVIAYIDDVIKITHLLTFNAKPEIAPRAKTARRLQLMTANSTRCKQGKFPVNHYALMDGDKIEDLGPEVNVTKKSWYPKAMSADGKFHYNVNSPEFREVLQGNNHHTMHGAEFVLELENGEMVRFFGGSKGARRQTQEMLQSEDTKWTFSSVHMQTAKFAWTAIKITPTECLWMGETIPELGDKRLWNIHQAIKKGHWVSGNKHRISERVAQALVLEYKTRKSNGHYSKKKVKKIKAENKEYDRR